jgi:acyl-CoA reductase-like NAD-dependent aldehyde dehydrogenase
MHGPAGHARARRQSPQLVFDDAPNLDRLAGLIAGAITGNAGQVCVAGSRMIVQRRIAPALLERIARRFAAHRPGATWDEQATLPPIVSAGQAQRIDEIVQQSVAAGDAFRAEVASTTAVPVVRTPSTLIENVADRIQRCSRKSLGRC